MTEILTESFCERCGTRYTFESARPKTRLKGVKVLSRGLKNFVLSDDTSIDEAMAAARSETDREATAHQLDAFHKTFNFCMSCRQYTCPNCWNEPEARCLSCAPLELPEAPVRLEDLGAFGEAGAIGETGLIGEVADRNGTPGDHQHDAWPATIEATDQPEEGLAADATHAPETPAVADVDADPGQKAAAQTTGLLQRFRPGQSLDAELDAFERERGQAAEATVAASDSPEPAVEATEPAVQATEEPAATETVTPGEASQPAATPEPEPQPLAAASAADVVEQPTWRITAPDASGATPQPPSAEPAGSPVPAGAQPAEGTSEPQWPARPQWPATAPTAGLPFLGRPATGQGGIEALWAASNQEIVTAPPPPGRAATSSIQPCVNCGLSLSATAKFCRRCGTLQAR